MLIQISLLLLSAGVYTSHAYSTTESPESSTEDELFGQLEMFPESFLSKFPKEGEFFRVKILGYLIFNLFAKHFGETEPSQYWSRFNQNNFNRAAIDAAFYEYLTKFADRKMKHLIYDPLKSSTSIPVDIAIHRIGDYLENLSADEESVDQSATRLQETKTKYHKHHNTKISVHTPIFGIAGKDFPNYYDIPKTSFTCANKLVPGIYADIETECQVFHTCWPRRIDSYLCPIGTTFNQALLTCDFWNESDCSSAPLLFGQPPFAMGKTPKGSEPTLATDDENQTTSERPATTPESDMMTLNPEYDGTCESLFCKPLHLNMKFPPVKCKVTDLEGSAQGGFDKDYVKRFDKIMAEVLSGNVGEMFEFIVKASELGSRMLGAAQRPELKVEKPTPKLDSKAAKVTTESPSKEGADTTIEQIYSSTTELPSDNKDNSSPRINSRFVEESVFKSTSHGKVAYSRSVRKSALLKPSKPSEDTIKQVFDTMATSLELGGRILNEGLLPLVEKIVLDSRRKKSASKS